MGNTSEFYIIYTGAAGLDMTNRQFFVGKVLATNRKGGYYIRTWIGSINELEQDRIKK